MLRPLVSIILIVCLLFVVPGFPVLGQSSSYIESIYQSMQTEEEGAISEIPYDDDELEMDEDDTSINVDVNIDLTDTTSIITGTITDTGIITATITNTSIETGTVTSTATDTVSITDTSTLTENLEKLADIINDLTRILIDIFRGHTPGINIVDILNPSGGTATSTGTNTSTSTVTQTQTSTSTATNTNTATNTATETVTQTNTATDTATQTQTSTETGTDTSTNTATQTQTTTTTNTNTNTQTTTQTQTNTSTNTNTNTNTSTATQTQTNTDVEVDKPSGHDKTTVEGMRSHIKDTYGINCIDGTAGWTLGQLTAAEEMYSQLPAGFVGATTQVVRDKELPGYNGVLGYVRSDKPSRVHILDLSVAVYGNTQAAIESTKRGFQHTLVHEMTHCLQFKYPNVYNQWRNMFWPGNRLVGTCPSAYGRTQPAEDMAESFAYFILGGTIKGNYFVTPGGSMMDLERYNFIKSIMNQLGGNY
jgi:hypothetical protein